MKITKEQLAVEYERAKDARDIWRTDYYNMKSERDNLQQEVDDLRWQLQRSKNQIHYLAWVLYWKWVSIDEHAWRLDIIVEEKPEKEYTTNTIWWTFTYCDANK